MSLLLKINYHTHFKSNGYFRLSKSKIHKVSDWSKFRVFNGTYRQFNNLFFVVNDLKSESPSSIDDKNRTRRFAFLSGLQTRYIFYCFDIF